MKAFGILLLLAAVFIIVNAANLRDVLQGKLKFNFAANSSTSSSGSHGSGGSF